MRIVFGIGIVMLGSASVCIQRVHADEPTPAQGEIRLDGTVRTIDAAASTLLMDATAFVLPSGKASTLATAKPKVVEITKATQIFVRGNAARKLTLADLKSGVFLIAIGSDNGGGKALPARQIAVWQRVTNGQFEFAAPNAAPPVTPPVTLPAPAPAPIVATPDGAVSRATSVFDGPLLTIRIKTGKPAAASDINLAPGTALPAALARLTRAPHIFTAALETAEPAPANATATLTMPEGLKRPNPGELRMTQPREMPVGMMRPFPAKIFWANKTDAPKMSELDGLTYGYYVRMGRPPQAYRDAASAAVGPRAAPVTPGTPPVAPPEGTSAVGDYVLQTSYAGQARFSVGADQDFLEPMKILSSVDKVDLKQPLTLQWQAVPRAIGYRVKAIGLRNKGTMPGSEIIIWTSSAVPPLDAQDEQAFDDPARAVREGLLLPATAMSCTIPAGLFNGLATVNFVAEAFGPGQVTKGNPSVRVIVQSENTFAITSSDAEAITNALEGTRPRPRPRPQELPTWFHGENKAWVQVSSSVNTTRAINQTGPMNSATYRYFTVNLAGKERAQEEMTATLTAPAGLFENAAAPLSLRVKPLTRSNIGSMVREAQLFWGSGTSVAEGQPVALNLAYDDQMALGYGTPRATFTGAATLASGPYGAATEILRPSSKGSAVGQYVLDSNFAGKATFAIETDNDFLAPTPVWLTSEATDFSKPVVITWQEVPGALGYRVTMVATRTQPGKGDSTVIWAATRRQPLDVRVVTSPLHQLDEALGRGDVLAPDVTNVTLPPGIFAGTREVRLTVEALGPTKVVAATPTAPAVQIASHSLATMNISQKP